MGLEQIPVSLPRKKEFRCFALVAVSCGSSAQSNERVEFIREAAFRHEVPSATHGSRTRISRSLRYRHTNYSGTSMKPMRVRAINSKINGHRKDFSKPLQNPVPEHRKNQSRNQKTNHQKTKKTNTKKTKPKKPKTPKPKTPKKPKNNFPAVFGV